MYKNRLYQLVVACGIMLTAAACNNGGKETSRGPIVLGDSATIVTETDSQYLRDYVTDFQPKEPEPEAPAEEAQPVKDTAQAAVPPSAPAEEPKPEVPAAAATGKGLSVDFNEIKIFIPGIATRTYGRNAVRNNSASFGLTDGKLNGNQLQISGGTITRVSQRYQTAVVLRNQLGALQLDALSYTSGWTTLKGGRNGYYISGLEDNKLGHSNPRASAIQNAVSRALRSKRLSKKQQREWQNSVRNVRSVNQKPLSVALHSVIWQIEGKDARGKSFRKELRIDLPI